MPQKSRNRLYRVRLSRISVIEVFVYTTSQRKATALALALHPGAVLVSVRRSTAFEYFGA